MPSRRGLALGRLRVFFLWAVALLAGRLDALGEESDTGSGAGWRFAPFSAAKGDFKIELKGYLQLDGRSFHEWQAEQGSRDPERELRRTRIGAELRWRRLRLEADADPNDPEQPLRDAYAALKLSRALWIQAGRFKLPVSPERLRSAARIDFVERSRLASGLAPGRDLGFAAFGRIGKWLSYEAGAFAGDGESGNNRAGTTGVGRLTVGLKGLEAGASFSQGDVRAQADRTSGPNGLRGDGASGYPFYDRHYVNGRRRRLDLNGSWTIGPASLKAERLEAREERRGQGPLCNAEGLVCEDLPEEVAVGWALSGTWLLGGAKKKSGKVEPERSLVGGPGALELALRYESLRFDDREPATGFESVSNRARNIRPAEVRVWTAGASWWPVAWGRLMANVVVERFLDPVLAPEVGRRGPYVTLVARLQIRLP